MNSGAMASTIVDTTIKVIDQKGKVIGELQKILKKIGNKYYN
jgi:hypothetical protein